MCDVQGFWKNVFFFPQIGEIKKLVNLFPEKQ
jgi:hypothetical protein